MLPLSVYFAALVSRLSRIRSSAKGVHLDGRRSFTRCEDGRAHVTSVNERPQAPPQHVGQPLDRHVLGRHLHEVALRFGHPDEVTQHVLHLVDGATDVADGIEGVPVGLQGRVVAQVFGGHVDDLQGIAEIV